jgi:asparagine synthase (glutamine-hydrolysing)
MCGITGLIHLSGLSIDPSLLLEMNLAIKHRGSDSQGVFIDRDIGLSNRRLHIIGEKNEGHQPMHFKERYHFVFNGTLYNYKALAEKLKAQNIPVHTSSDTEIAFTWLIHFGLINLSDWEGMYSFIFYDSQDKKVWIRRDSLGIKPLYYALLNGYLAVASETKSFFHFPDWTYEVDNEKINLFLTTGEREIKGDPFWKKAKAVPVGCTFIISYQCNRHFHLTIAADKNEKSDRFDFSHKPLSFKEATIQGRLLFENALNTHISGNGPLGFSLSGGLDSSLIFSLYKYFQPQNIPLAISYADMEKKEITALKNHFTADYYTLPIPTFEQFQDTHKEVVLLSEGPLPGPNTIYHFNIYAFAKQLGIKIMLSGQGADELFLGYPGFLTSYWKDLYINKKYTNLLSEVIHTSLNRKDLYKPLLQVFKNKKPGRKNKENISLSDHRDNTLLKSNLPYLLHAEDRHSLANNIEARVPFLDSQFLAFARILPASYSINQGKQKWILRAIGEDLLPKSILNNYAKKGFPAKMPEPNQREKSAFLSDVKEFISQNSHFFLPNRDPIQLFHQYPALAWRINSLQKWLKIYNIQAT